MQLRTCDGNTIVSGNVYVDLSMAEGDCNSNPAGIFCIFSSKPHIYNI